MKIWVLSDLHMTTFEHTLHGLSSVSPTVPEADLAVIAGDVGDGVETSAHWLAEHIRPHMPVVWVLGNHEYYGGWFRTSRNLARRLAKELDLTLLDDDVAVIDNIRFAGSTLWTDYDLYARGDENVRREHMVYARMYLSDHRQIDLEAGKILGVERGVPCSAAVREVVAPTLDEQNQVALNFVANLGDLLGPLPASPPNAAGEIDQSLLEVIGEEVAFGGRTPEDAGKYFVEEARALLERSAKG